MRARVRDGSIDVINESPFAPPSQRRLYARDVQVNANISTAGRSTYDVTLRYGERQNLLYPLAGRGVIDQTGGFIDQRWAAAQLPIAGALNFVVNSQTLRLQSGMLKRSRRALFRRPRYTRFVAATSRARALPSAMDVSLSRGSPSR